MSSSQLWLNLFLADLSPCINLYSLTKRLKHPEQASLDLCITGDYPFGYFIHPHMPQLVGVHSMGQGCSANGASAANLNNTGLGLGLTVPHKS